MKSLCDYRDRGGGTLNPTNLGGLGVIASFRTTVNGTKNVFLYVHVVSGSILKFADHEMQ
jgi:hypothetical protein